MTHFEVGKCYRLGEEGKTLYRIESRTEKSALIAKLYDDGSIAETMRKKIYTEECGNIKEERIYPLGKSGTSAYSVISSRYEAESTNTSQPEASQPEVASTQSETATQNDLPAKFLNANSEADFNARLSLLEKLPISLLINFARSEMIDTIGIPAEKMPAYVHLILNERLSNINRGLEITDKGIAVQTPLLTLYRESRGFLPANIRFRVATQYYGTDKNGEKHVVFIDRRQPDTVCAILVYDGNSHKVYGVEHNAAVSVRDGVEKITFFKFGCPGAIEDLEFTVSADSVKPDYNDPDYPGYIPATQSEICYETHYKETRYKEEFKVSSETNSQPEIANNSGFTVEPSHEIERPNYTPYTDTITDYCPYVNISPCYTPTHNNAAVVPYEHAASIRNFFHIIAIYLRLWLAMHIHTQPDVIQSLVFAPWIVELKDYEPDDPHDVSPLIYKWQRKKFYEKLKLCRSQIASCKTREEIIACLQRVSSESIRLLCVADRVMNKFTRISANSECERKLAYAQIYADKIIQRREKAITINAKAKESESIPQPCSDNKQQTQSDAPKLQKLYLASDYKEYNKIRRENKALIDACDSEEGIVALMLTLSTTGILNQADYCRVSLFNADRKTDEQLAREFAAAIMKRRAKKLKASQQKTQSQPRKENPAPASDSEHTLIDTKDLHFSDRRKALEHNAAVITPCLFPEAAVALLMSISAKAIIQLGLYLGLFIAKQKGSKNAVIQEFVKRLFNLRETRSNQQNSNYATTPSQFTLHIPEGVKIVQLKNRQLGFIFIN